MALTPVQERLNFKIKYEVFHNRTLSISLASAPTNFFLPFLLYILMEQELFTVPQIYWEVSPPFRNGFTMAKGFLPGQHRIFTLVKASAGHPLQPHYLVPMTNAFQPSFAAAVQPPPGSCWTSLYNRGLASYFLHSILLLSFLVLHKNYFKNLFPLLAIKSLSYCVVSSLRTGPSHPVHCCTPNSQQSARET